MKIKISNDALESFYEESDFLLDIGEIDFGEYQFWEKFWSSVSGKWVEVDETNLFKYEYDVLPIKNVTSEVVRVLDDFVEEVEDDVRYGKARCELCNTISSSTNICKGCGKSDYLELLYDEF